MINLVFRLDQLHNSLSVKKYLTVSVRIESPMVGLFRKGIANIAFRVKSAEKNISIGCKKLFSINALNNPYKK